MTFSPTEPRGRIGGGRQRLEKETKPPKGPRGWRAPMAPGAGRGTNSALVFPPGFSTDPGGGWGRDIPTGLSQISWSGESLVWGLLPKTTGMGISLPKGQKAAVGLIPKGDP